jgi:hypothetical protein
MILTGLILFLCVAHVFLKVQPLESYGEVFSGEKAYEENCLMEIFLCFILVGRK